jgi:tRNA(adenine34) deaminase
MSPSDVTWMDEALELAQCAGSLGNVPVGAVLVVDGVALARSHNLREVLQDPIAHAELLALQGAAQRLGRWRMPDATLYVTLEFCSMCAGAIAQARVGRLVYAAEEPRTGAVVSARRLLEGTATEVVALTARRERTLELMRTFFATLRARGSTDSHGEVAELVEGA